MKFINKENIESFKVYIYINIYQMIFTKQQT